jgi:hypothetical protein
MPIDKEVAAYGIMNQRLVCLTITARGVDLWRYRSEENQNQKQG